MKAFKDNKYENELAIEIEEMEVLCKKIMKLLDLLYYDGNKFNVLCACITDLYGETKSDIDLQCTIAILTEKLIG